MKKSGRRSPKTVLRLPDLKHAKSAVLNNLASPESRRSYEFAIQNFVHWYCSEPRLAFNRIVVTRYRMQLEQLHLAPSTINQHLAAVRRLAYEAFDAGLLSPELAAGIKRVKGAKQLGVRLGNWLTADQGRAPVEAPSAGTLRGKRDRAILAVLLGCGLRRSELVHLKLEDVQQREGHWAIVDLVGKGGHIRTVPVPDWVKKRIDEWTEATATASGCLFRSINKSGSVWGNGLTEKVVWYVVRNCAKAVGIEKIAVHDLRRTRAEARARICLRSRSSEMVSMCSRRRIAYECASLSICHNVARLFHCSFLRAAARKVERNPAKSFDDQLCVGRRA